MEEFYTNAAPPPNHFNFPDGGDSPRQPQHRHHSNSSSGYPQSRKLQSEKEYLKERVLTSEKAIGKLYQLISSRKYVKSPPTFNHKRSASVSHQFDENSLTPSPILESHQVNGYGIEYDDIFNPIPQVSFHELKASVEKLLSERDRLLSEVDDFRQITDAAKRERVLAIDEKDQLLRETHLLRVALESTQSALSSIEEERDSLKEDTCDLQNELALLKRDNEKANEMRSLELEERLKIIEECSALQQELRNFQTERDELYEETLQQQAQLDELVGEKRKLERDLEWMDKNGCAVSRNPKDEIITVHGKPHDVIDVNLKRTSHRMPWGFTFEGGRGTEFFHHDPSIVITGVANHTPAADILRFGDRILSFGKQNFHNITRKEAAEMIRSCDLMSVALEISRTSANIKPAPQEVKIPGKKDFGFSYESRLFVTSAEEESAAAEVLFPGDEILQVQGRSAFNMKPSALKQLLKSCKDGVMLTVQRQPGLTLSSLATNSAHRPHQTTSLGRLVREGAHDTNSVLQLNGTKSSAQRLSNEFTQSPGTPRSCISESSAGYHSLTHSMPPGEISSTLIHVGPDSKTGQLGPEQDPKISMVSERSLDTRHYSEGTSLQEVEGVPGYRTSSVGGAMSNGFSRSSYRNRPSDLYSPRRNTVSAYQNRSGPGHRPRAYTMNAYKSVPSINPDNSRTDHHYLVQRVATPLTPGPQPVTTPVAVISAFSMSADNLDSEPTGTAPIPPPGPTSHLESHDKAIPLEGCGTPPTHYSRGHLSMSMGNMQTHV